MICRCVCNIDERVTAVLRVNHVFLCGMVAIPTVAYYNALYDRAEAMVDCHALALLSANIVLKQYGAELSEE